MFKGLPLARPECKPRLKSKSTLIYQTWCDDEGTANGRWHASEESKNSALADVDNVGHDTYSIHEIVLDTDGVVFFLNTNT